MSYGQRFTSGITLPWQQRLQQWQRRPPPSLPSSYQVDPTARFTGTVTFYQKWRGYGFIEPTQKGLIPTEKVFVHWKAIESEDRFPCLTQGLEVEFGLSSHKDWQKGINTLRATNVTLAGGGGISLQDDLDAKDKTFVGGQFLRYTGTLKFFSPRHGFGYVAMDEGYDVDPSVPSNLRVDREEVNAGGQSPSHMQGIPVEFGIWRTEQGQYRVYNMTLPGGHPLTQDALENRITLGGATYRGQVAKWNWRYGWGFIRPDSSAFLPPRVLQKLAEQAEAARQRGKHISEDKLLYFRRADCQPGLMITQGFPVSFQVYVDDKGAGANEVGP